MDDFSMYYLRTVYHLFFRKYTVFLQPYNLKSSKINKPNGIQRLKNVKITFCLWFLVFCRIKIDTMFNALWHFLFFCRRRILIILRSERPIQGLRKWPRRIIPLIVTKRLHKFHVTVSIVQALNFDSSWLIKYMYRY